MFSKRLSECRKLKGLTQQKLGELVGTHKQAVNNWEKGLASPNLNTFRMLCEYLGVSADYLLGLTDKSEMNK